MLFHTRQKCVNIDENSIVTDGNIIPFTTNTMFLGINIDNNLTWKAHINYITTKISKGVGVLLRLTYLLITYETYINKIFTIQKKAIRIITHSPFQCHSSPLFK